MIDTFVVLASVVLAYLVRFNFSIPANELVTFPLVLAYITGVRLITFMIGRTYAGIIRYTSTQDAVRIAVVIASGSLIFVITNLITFYGIDRFFFIPFSIIIIEFISSIFGMTTFRLIVKIAYLEYINPRKERSGVIIFGAGEAGIITKRTLDRDAGTRLRVVGFVDDDERKAGSKLEGVSIVHSSRLEAILKEGKAETLIISIQEVSATRKAQVIDLCLQHNIRVLNIPPVVRWINGELSFRQLKEINIVDLLERDVIQMDRQRLKSELQGKRILITGASGSIGSEIVRQAAIFGPASMLLLDQAETPLFEIENEVRLNFPEADLRVVIADITHYSRLEKIFSEYHPQVVFHAAAYKHVPMMELNPSEAVHTNVIGTRNLADISLGTGVEKFIMISTDKAVNPSSVMGATKRMAEMYVQAMDKPGSTRFITTRFGNVLGSNGSVIPLFRKQIEKGGPITITHPEITRYFMTIPEACQLVLEAGAMGQGGEIFLFDMGESVKIIDLARKMIRLSGLELGKDIQIVYTGLRPGEKLYEELLADQENSLPTYHPKILIAKVRPLEPEMIKDAIVELERLLPEDDPLLLVSLLKRHIPEFRSSHSVFSSLDGESA